MSLKSCLFWPWHSKRIPSNYFVKCASVCFFLFPCVQIQVMHFWQELTEVLCLPCSFMLFFLKINMQFVVRYFDVVLIYHSLSNVSPASLSILWGFSSTAIPFISIFLLYLLVIVSLERIFPSLYIYLFISVCTFGFLF